MIHDHDAETYIASTLGQLRCCRVSMTFFSYSCWQSMHVASDFVYYNMPFEERYVSLKKHEPFLVLFWDREMRVVCIVQVSSGRIAIIGFDDFINETKELTFLPSSVKSVD